MAHHRIGFVKRVGAFCQLFERDMQVGGEGL